eukprot:CAMPEP_0194211966 /NCGR_PEP_ID=MMETSP0156-20130528/11416_1 /TAXON_ID=33649 /ORGANISM="Thalassionema nitzschioides, Strain L26-B" /LENGTH=305 /DNA_ID=CAMNT_0038939659 /DNA_START=139 /DNA_END=1056 /DNA_ORIENTATION=-
MLNALGQAHSFLLPVNKLAQRSCSKIGFSLQAKQKRRRRKNVSTDNPVEPTDTGSKNLDFEKNIKTSPKIPFEPISNEDDMDVLQDVVNFEFKPDDMIASDEAAEGDDDSLFTLPDIKDALRKREMQGEIARIKEEEKELKPKVKRGDLDAYQKLLQKNPFGDADEELFIEENYSAVSALLAERAAPFLGIPSGPIQVGHFIGALGIILMAFVEYPGFPLTNLPTIARECLRGGLATVYSINAVLAVMTIFKATERGQPVALWISKTFVVGGLAFDQLTQLPTLEEIEVAKSLNGMQGRKNRRGK